MHIPPPHPPHHENAYFKRVCITFNNETLTTVDQLKTQTNPDTLELSLSLTCDGHIQGSLSSIKDEGTEYCPAS